MHIRVIKSVRACACLGACVVSRFRIPRFYGGTSCNTRTRNGSFEGRPDRSIALVSHNDMCDTLLAHLFLHFRESGLILLFDHFTAAPGACREGKRARGSELVFLKEGFRTHATPKIHSERARARIYIYTHTHLPAEMILASTS